MQKISITLGTATPGGGFPFFGEAAAATINEMDPGLQVIPQNTAGSAENIRLLEASKLDMALVAGEPAYEAFAGIGRPATELQIVSAIYSSPGMFAVSANNKAAGVKDLVGQPIAWGTRSSGITLLGKYIMDGLGLDRDKSFEPHYLDKAEDGLVLLAEGKVSAQWGAGIGWPNFTKITAQGGRLIGFTSAEIDRIRSKHSFLKHIVVPPNSYPGQSNAIQSVGSWSYILARPALNSDITYRLVKALHAGHSALVDRASQAVETTPENILQSATDMQRVHSGVLMYLRDTKILPQ